MNYTTNYHLPQWVETDRIQMEHFNQAMADIDTGVAAAQTAADNKGYIIGSYIGNGSTQAINLGFRPNFLFIGASQPSGTSSSDGASLQFCAILDGGGDRLSGRALLTDTGFTVSVVSSSHIFPLLNQNGYAYRYLAFR